MARPLAQSPYRLLVEGPNDKYSVINLLIRHGFDWDDESFVRPYISEEGGIDGLLRAIPIAVKGTHQRIGLVLDANSDPAARWAEIRKHAKKAELDLPDTSRPEGIIVPGLTDESRIGVWLMPDNTSPGTLEHFLDRLVSAGDRIRAYADEAVIEARRRGARCQEREHIKSALHTWLAWQEEPGLPFGKAMEAEYFEKESEEALRFVAWFRRLFVEP